MNSYKRMHFIIFLAVALSSGSLLAMSSRRLVSAVNKGDVAAAQKAIEQGADVNAKEILSLNRKTALMLAIERNDLPMAKLLIEKGANVNARNWLGQSPLIIAADKGHLDMARLLLDSGAIFLKPTLDPMGHSQKYRTALMHAAARNNLPMVQLLLERGADPTVRIGILMNYFNQSLNETLGIKEIGPDDPRAQFIGLNTTSALDLAAIVGNEKMIQLLLDSASFGPAARGLAARKAMLAGHPGAVLLLFKGLEEDTFAYDFALTAAIRANNSAEVQRLLDEGASVDAKDWVPFGTNALGLAISMNNPEIVQLLLDRKARYAPGSLFQALMGGNMEVARLLFREGYGSTFERLLFRIFNKVSVTKPDMKILMNYAVKKARNAPITEQEQAQMKAAAKRTGIAITVITALVTAGKLYHIALVENLHTAAASGSVVKTRAFLAMGHAVDQRDWPMRRTPLMRAARYGHENVARVLIGHGANVNAQDLLGKTPLIYAARLGHENVARVLLTHGVNVDAQDPQGVTPLMHAIQNNQVSMVKLLLQHGPNLQMQDNNGLKAYDYAAPYPAIRRELTWYTRKALEAGRREPTSPLFGLPPEIAEIIAREAAQ